MVAATSEELVTLSATQVVVHPLVLLSVADHAARVKGTNNKRVVGVLLGQDTGASHNIANSFAVPFEEDEKDPRTWFLDHDFVESMCDMFRKISAKEKLVGWYHTGPKLRASDLQINEVFKKYCARPVMVIVDVRPEKDLQGSVTDAYFAVEEIKDDGTSTQKTFMHVPSTIEAEEAEAIGVEHLLRDIKDLSTGSLSTRVSQRLHSLRGLQTRLLEIRDYLDAVVAGKMPINHQVIFNLQDIFNLLPNIDLSGGAAPSSAREPINGSAKGGDVEMVNGAVANGKSGAEIVRDARGRSRPLTIATNDQLLVMYLSSLIRAVIALHGLVNNKLENQSLAAGEDAGVPAEGASDEAKKKDAEAQKKKDESAAKDDASRGL